MSRFNKYAQELKRLVTEKCIMLKCAENKYNDAKAEAEKYPERHGFVDQKYQVEHLKRKLAFEEATQNLRRVKNTVATEFEADIRELRENLSKDATDYFAVDPSKLSPEIVSFLNSDILDVADYKKLMRVAEEDNNVSMIRMIADRASKAQKACNDVSKRQELGLIAHTVDKYKVETYMDAFDSMVSVANTCLKNTRVFDRWDQLGMDSTIDNF